MAFKAFFIQCMLEKGFLASTIFYATYAHQDSHVERYLTAVDETFSTIADLTSSGSLEKKMKGAPATQGFKRLA